MNKDDRKKRAKAFRDKFNEAPATTGGKLKRQEELIVMLQNTIFGLEARIEFLEKKK